MLWCITRMDEYRERGERYNRTVRRDRRAQAILAGKRELEDFATGGLLTYNNAQTHMPLGDIARNCL